MFEDSINSSPSNCNKSIHDVRFLRRSIRKQIDCEKNKVNPETLLREFYHDSEDESGVFSKTSNPSVAIANPISIVKKYKPFQLEMSFLAADKVVDNEYRRPFPISESQGFYSCQRLAENEDKFNTNAKTKNTSFTITESELISCCNQAEKVFNNVSPKKTERSHVKLLADDMSLVNSILEDFSQSPLKERQITNTTHWQYSPEFRLRKLPKKTYSRKCLKKTRTNLSKYFSNQPPLDLIDEHDTCSNCSSLSVQEDVAITGTISSPPISASDKFQSLCENLLNLSVYFTQHNLYNFEESCSNKLTQDIINLRSNYKIRNESYNSLEDFCGFYNSTDSDEDDNNNSIDIANRPNESQNISINFENSESVDNWNKDSCEQIFADINTEEIMQKQNKYQISRKNNSILETIQNKPIDIEIVNPVEFQTSSTNPTKVPKKTCIIASKLLRKSQDILSEQNINLDNCDIRTPIEDKYIFENPKDYKWNDDCDIFVNFQTPIDLKENSKPELQQENEKALFQLQNDRHLPNEKIVSSSLKMYNEGFKTASGKNLSISKKAQQSVQQILNEINKEFTESLNCNELQEIKNKIYTRKLKQNEQISVNKTTFEKNCIVKQKMDNENFENKDRTPEVEKDSKGLQTANGKNVVTSSKANEMVNNILSNVFVETKQNIETDLLLIKQEITNKNHELKSLKSTTSNLSPTHKKTELSVVNEGSIAKLPALAKSTKSQHLNDVEVEYTNENKDHSITGDSMEKLILSEWPLPTHCESFSSGTIKKNFKENDSFKNCIPLSNNLRTNIGFQTANGKKISVSTNAHRAVEKLLLEVDIDFDATNIENNLKNLKTDILNKNAQLEKTNINIKSSANQANFALAKLCKTSSSVLNQKPSENNLIITDFKTNFQNSKKDHGFQTANGKSVSISSKAQKVVENLLQEFETDLDNETCESNLEEIKKSIQEKNKSKLKVNCLINQYCTQEINEYTNMLSETESNRVPVFRNGKRRLSLNNRDLTKNDDCSPPSPKILKKGLHNTHSSIAELSIKSPLTRPNNFVMSGKNLLSLTKRKKSKINSNFNIHEISKMNQETSEETLNIVTPIKSINSLRDSEKTPVTPNLKEFFTDAPHTSTPRSNSSLCKSRQTIDELDFKPIKWNNNNETSINTSPTLKNQSTKISETSSSNVTLNSSNPTAKERIGRLKMYGKAPAVSPILIETHNNCRPSGLRRTRSMLKKVENN